MDRQSIAERIAAGPGPKITDADITAAIAKVDYWQPAGTTSTVCCLQLRNGFTVIGSSACADPANFNEQLGRDLAFDDARDQVWHLLGFQLREELYRAHLKIAEGLTGGTSADASRAALASLPEADRRFGQPHFGHDEYETHTQGAPLPTLPDDGRNTA